MNIAFIEDNESDKNLLIFCINKFLESRHVSFSLDAFNKVEDFPLNKKYDLVFLDILVFDKNGFEFARKMRQIYSEEDTAIIFTTTLSSYAIEGYEVGASSYILKPYTYDDFVLKTKKVFEKLFAKEDKTISLYTRDKEYITLDLSEILYIESSGHYLTFYTKNNKSYEVRGSMAECEKKYVQLGFYRINNWYLVYLPNISKVQGNDAYIANKVLGISRARKKGFLLAFSKVLGI